MEAEKTFIEGIKPKFLKFISLDIFDGLKKEKHGFKPCLLYENDVLFSDDTGILGKRNSEFSQQESNLRPSDYWSGR